MAIVRWELLFDDLQARLTAEESLELAAEVADRTRRERAQLGLQERLAAARHTGQVTVRVAGLGVISGAVIDVGADWVLLAPRGEGRVLAPFAALRAIAGLDGRLAPSGAVVKGFTFGAALRAVSRDRAPVTLVDIDGQRVTGTIDAVGQDALDLAEHPLELPRRPQHVRAVSTIPFAAVGGVLRG
ncbi:MAG: hypothetical protein WAR57_09080 [Candidatus Phosphoribacter sp.]|nr:hypothetical protein [Actinomycetales bacterium]